VASDGQTLDARQCTLDTRPKDAPQTVVGPEECPHLGFVAQKAKRWPPKCTSAPKTKETLAADCLFASGGEFLLVSILDSQFPIPNSRSSFFLVLVPHSRRHNWSPKGRHQASVFLSRSGRLTGAT